MCVISKVDIKLLILKKLILYCAKQYTYKKERPRAILVVLYLQVLMVWLKKKKKVLKGFRNCRDSCGLGLFRICFWRKVWFALHLKIFVKGKENRRTFQLENKLVEIKTSLYQRIIWRGFF